MLTVVGNVSVGAGPAAGIAVGKLGIAEDRINLQGEEREKHDSGVSRQYAV